MTRIYVQPEEIRSFRKNLESAFWLPDRFTLPPLPVLCAARGAEAGFRRQDKEQLGLSRSIQGCCAGSRQGHLSLIICSPAASLPSLQAVRHRVPPSRATGS